MTDGERCVAVNAANPPAPRKWGAGPAWLRPLIDNIDGVRGAYRRRVPADVLASIGAANAAAGVLARRDAAVLVLFSGAADAPAGAVPADADLLVTMRAATLRHRRAGRPGGASDPGDDGPVGTALREAFEETGIDVTRLQTLATLEANVHPALGISRRPGVGVLSVIRVRSASWTSRDGRGGTSSVARLRQSGEPVDGVSGGQHRRFAGPAFLLNQMLVWGFTGQVISAMLDVAGWAQPWDDRKVLELDDAMARVGEGAR